LIEEARVQIDIDTDIEAQKLPSILEFSPSLSKTVFSDSFICRMFLVASGLTQKRELLCSFWDAIGLDQGGSYAHCAWTNHCSKGILFGDLLALYDVCFIWKNKDNIQFKSSLTEDDKRLEATLIYIIEVYYGILETLVLFILNQITQKQGGPRSYQYTQSY
jgi:hypothetical protein